MPCEYILVPGLTDNIPRLKYVCWPDGDDAYRYVDPTGPFTPVYDPTQIGDGFTPIYGQNVDTSGFTPVYTPVLPGEDFTPIDTPLPTASPPSPLDLNPGWNAGGHSEGSLATDWVGVVEFDVPDIGGSLPGGVAAGFVAASRAPISVRSGYSHLKYGVVLTTTAFRLIHDSVVVLDLPRSTIVAARDSAEKDFVEVQLDGSTISWRVNGDILFTGAFSMSGEFVLDATLYLTYDAVDNPVFKPDATFETSSLNAVLPPLVFEGDGTVPTGLTGSLPPLQVFLSATPISEIRASLRGLTMLGGVGGDLTGTLGRFEMVASNSARYAFITTSIGRLSAEILMGPTDPTVVYASLVPTFPRFTMVATTPIVARIEASFRPLTLVASSASSYADMAVGFQGLRMRAYGGALTPLVQIPETVFSGSVIQQMSNISLAVTEVMRGSSTMMVMATVTADGTEEVSVQEMAEVTQTILNSIAEQIAVGERVSAFARAVGGGVAPGEGNAWAVNTDSSASSRYEGYDFNSFAAVKGMHFGARRDGVYLLEGEDDAGAGITSGISLGKHDFGTKALKCMDAIYAGVSSTGALFIRVGDGVNSYTYRARRNDQRLRTQRFDVGRGLRASYLTLDLTSDADAFELDSVTFHILPTTRKI